MTVYIEYVFLNNLAVNYLISYLTLLAMREDISASRLLISGGVGALFSVLYIFYSGNILIIKILLSVAMVLLIRKRFSSPKDFLVTLLIFYIISFAFAGAAVMLAERLNINDGLNGLAVSGGVLVSFVAIQYLAKALHQIKNKKCFEYVVEITTTNGTHRCNGYYDSGNKLNVNGKPAVVISRALFERLNLPIVGDVAVNTVGGIKILELINLTFKIYYGNGVNKIYNTQAAVSDNIRYGGYDIILHREMGGDNEATYRKNQGNNKKISNPF